MHCEICGVKLSEDARFCDSCGAPQVDSPAQPAADPAGSTGKLLSKESAGAGIPWGFAIFAAAFIAILLYAASMRPQQTNPSGPATPSPALSRPASQTPSPRPEPQNPDAMLQEVVNFCKELQRMKEGGRISFSDVNDYCFQYNAYGGVAFGLGNPEGMRQYYQTAREKFQQILRKAGMDPNARYSDMDSLKRPSQTLLQLRVFRPLMGNATPGMLTITDVNYVFSPDGGLRNQPDEAGYWFLSGAAAQRMGMGGLIETYGYACTVIYKQGGTRLNLSSFFTNDQATTDQLCSTLNQAIAEYNRRNPNVY